MARKSRLPYTLRLRGETYHARYSFIHEGRRIQFEETTRSADIDQAHRIAVDRVANFKLHDSGSHTIDEAFGRFFQEKGNRQSAPDNLKRRLVRWMEFLGAETPLENITQADVTRYVQKRESDGIGASTINRDFNDLIAVCNAARFWGWEVPRFQISKLRPPVLDREIEYFTDDEVRAIIQAAAPHFALIVRAALLTGFRKRNILNLKWDNVDYYLKKITIKVKDRGVAGGRLHSIPITAQLEELLNSIPRDGEYVFTFEGHAIKDIKTAWKATLRRAKIRHRPFHTLRHTCATWLFNKDVDAAVVSKILGHKKVDTTMKFYAAVIDDKKREALDLLRV